MDDPVNRGGLTSSPSGLRPWNANSRRREGSRDIGLAQYRDVRGRERYAAVQPGDCGIIRIWQGASGAIDLNELPVGACCAEAVTAETTIIPKARSSAPLCWNGM